jgi:hypothetical protein
MKMVRRGTMVGACVALYAYVKLVMAKNRSKWLYSRENLHAAPDGLTVDWPLLGFRTGGLFSAILAHMYRSVYNPKWVKTLKELRSISKIRNLEELTRDPENERFIPETIPKVVIKYVQMAKTRFGTPKRSLASENSVRRYVERLMDEHNVRHCDRACYIAQVIEYTFVPMDYEIYWRGQAESYDYQARVKAYSGQNDQ